MYTQVRPSGASLVNYVALLCLWSWPALV